MTTQLEPLTELEVLITDTNSLAVPESEKALLIATLQPIAADIPKALALAANVKVENQIQAAEAAVLRDHLNEAADRAENAIREFHGGLLDRLFKAHRKGTALINSFGVLRDAAKRVKGTIIGWQQAEADKAEKGRQRLQAEADERARRERERLEKEASKLKTPELREQRMEAAAAVVAPVVYVQAPKQAVKSQSRWFVKSIDAPAFIQAAAKDPALIGFLTIDEQRLLRAKSANAMVEIPGIVFEKRLV